MFEFLIKECNTEYSKSDSFSKDKEMLTALEEAGFKNSNKLLIAKVNKYVEISFDNRIKFLRNFAQCEGEKEGHKKQGHGNSYLRDNGNIDLYFCIPGGWGDWYEHQFTWVETPIENYNRIPPKFCLDKVIKAKELEIFDSFAVCEIQKDRPYADPIVVGLIKNNDSRFFIAQWDNDITLDDLI